MQIEGKALIVGVTDRKELQSQYKEREVLGGVYAIRNTIQNKLFLDVTADLHGMQNRFAFAQKTGSGLHLKLQQDWAAQKGEGFVFEILDEMVKSREQSNAAFLEELNLLKDMWLEKLGDSDLY